jgi:hypothetical protein
VNGWITTGIADPTYRRRSGPSAIEKGNTSDDTSEKTRKYGSGDLVV